MDLKLQISYPILYWQLIPNKRCTGNVRILYASPVQLYSANHANDDADRGDNDSKPKHIYERKFICFKCYVVHQKEV